MFRKFITRYCPVCSVSLGTFDQLEISIANCPTEDCKIKWCWKPKDNLPVALDYPGKKEAKICKCESCKTRKD